MNLNIIQCYTLKIKSNYVSRIQEVSPSATMTRNGELGDVEVEYLTAHIKGVVSRLRAKARITLAALGRRIKTAETQIQIQGM